MTGDGNILRAIHMALWAGSLVPGSMELKDLILKAGE